MMLNADIVFVTILLFHPIFLSNTAPYTILPFFKKLSSYTFTKKKSESCVQTTAEMGVSLAWHERKKESCYLKKN